MSRPKNTGKYGEPTVPIRVPVRFVDRIIKLIKEWING